MAKYVTIGMISSILETICLYIGSSEVKDDTWNFSEIITQNFLRTLFDPELDVQISLFYSINEIRKDLIDPESIQRSHNLIILQQSLNYLW